jgi:hypothetical protein
MRGRIGARSSILTKALAADRMPWSTPFEDPIDLPRGRQLVTLQHAADYIMKLSGAERDTPEWQAAGEALTMGKI